MLRLGWFTWLKTSREIGHWNTQKKAQEQGSSDFPNPHQEDVPTLPPFRKEPGRSPGEN